PPSTLSILTLSLHDALPIFHFGHRHRCCDGSQGAPCPRNFWQGTDRTSFVAHVPGPCDGRGLGLHQRLSAAASQNRSRAADLARSEEHTSELQSHLNLVCRL